MFFSTLQNNANKQNEINVKNDQRLLIEKSTHQKIDGPGRKKGLVSKVLLFEYYLMVSYFKLICSSVLVCFRFVVSFKIKNIFAE